MTRPRTGQPITGPVMAGLVAGLAVACFITIVVLGPQVGWVVETGGGPGDVFDVKAELPWMTVLLAGTLVGTLLAARRPRHPIPWLLAAAGIGFLAYPAVLVAVEAATADRLVPGWAPYVAWVGNWVWLVGMAGVFYLLLLFPNGRALSHRWRVVARALAGYLAVTFAFVVAWPELDSAPALDNPFGVEALRAATPLFERYLLGGFIVLPALCVSCLVLRFVRSRGAERQQMKWMAYGATVFGVTTVVALPLGAPRWVLAVAQAFLVAPVVVAVTRYRLYEIDRIISRTVTYGVVAGLLAAVFAGIAIGLPRLLSLPGESPLLVAVSTLTVAALFNPLRRRVQAVVDRRFNRARYDALLTVEAFTSRLRDEVDIDELSRELVGVATTALQPTSVSVWLRQEPSK